MANKFEGDWKYHFLIITETGTVTYTPKGKFHLIEIDNSGNIKQAKDDDNKPLTGHISKAGPLEVIHLNRADNPVRHLRGVLVFEGVVNGVLSMVLMGERRKDPFPDGNGFTREKVGDKKERGDLVGQEDGTWIATKP